MQVAYADIVLLNKVWKGGGSVPFFCTSPSVHVPHPHTSHISLQMDVAGEEAVVRAEAHIKAINSRVQILKTDHCQVELGLILDR